jgi:hypothetical protein
MLVNGDRFAGSNTTVHRILANQALRPHKVTYYLERRDADFVAKMKEVLLVYQEVALQNKTVSEGRSVEFIALLKDLDGSCPVNSWTLR